MTRPLLLILTIFMLFALLGCSSPTPQKKDLPVYKIGYMICNSEQETLQRFKPFSAFLGKKMGVQFETIAIDTINFTRKVDELDFVHTNSLLYIILNRFHGVEILAAEKKGSLGIHSQGVIVSRKDRGINSIKDLKGKSMIFGPMLAPTGFMSQVDAMQTSGIDPENDLSFYTIPSGSFKHEKVLYGVMFEKYDAGSLPIDDIEQMAKSGRIDMDDFNIIEAGPAIPYCNFAVTQKTDAALAAKFKEVILSITDHETVQYNGETVKVLDTALVQGYQDIKDGDFDIIREMAKRTNMPPYQQY